MRKLFVSLVATTQQYNDKLLNVQVFGSLVPAAQDWKLFTCHATARSSVTEVPS